MIGQYSEILPTRYGNMIALKCDQHIHGALALYGESTQQEIDCCLQFVQPGQTVLDVGANIGTFAISLGLKVGQSGNLIAIEPQRLPYLCLCGNIAINSMAERIQPMRAAVGDTCGSIDVPIVNPWVEGNNIGGVRLGQPSEVSDVAPLITIDSMKLPELHFMKVDVEGMEHKVLRGAKETIERCRPVIFAECLPEDRENAKGMFELFREWKYEARHVVCDLFPPRNLRMNSFNIFGGQCNYNVLAIPSGPPEWFGTLPLFEG